LNKISRFKAVFFDAGGTLFTPYPSVGEIYSAVAARYGCSVSQEILETQFREEWIRRDRVPVDPTVMPQERQWWYDLVKDVFSNFGGVDDFESFFHELYDIFAQPEYWRIFPEVEEVIKHLKGADLVLGIVSNWDSRLIPLCDKLGFGKTFDFILASGIVGSSKPDAGIFQEALKRSGVEPHEVVHVGDSLKDDVEGSKRLGIMSVLLDRSGKKLYPVPTITSLTELIPLVFLK
jgi:putative hydrolase of the HAD superfamily